MLEGTRDARDWANNPENEKEMSQIFDRAVRWQVAMEGLQQAMALVHETANEAGWYHDLQTGKPIERNFGEVVALMHSELSEALEADRKGLMDDKLIDRPGQEVEFADAVIRIMDTCAARGYDLAGAMREKDAFNRQRADHKMEARAKNGGKAY